MSEVVDIEIVLVANEKLNRFKKYYNSLGYLDFRDLSFKQFQDFCLLLSYVIHYKDFVKELNKLDFNDIVFKLDNKELVLSELYTGLSRNKLMNNFQIVLLIANEYDTVRYLDHILIIGECLDTILMYISENGLKDMILDTLEVVRDDFDKGYYEVIVNELNRKLE